MDREQEEMQFLGVFGIYKESCKIIVSWRKIFSQITLALILPLFFIFLAHIEVSNILYDKIVRTEFQLEDTQAGTPRYDRLSDHISSERAYFWIFEAAYLTLSIIFSLLSTSAVVYTIACIYTGRDVDFKKVMSVVPKVWKRLMVTFLCIFTAMFAYHMLFILLAFVVFFMWVLFVAPVRTNVLYAIWIGLLILYLVGMLYMQIVWQLANVVSVLEEACGVKAMSKSRALIKGKMWVAVIVNLKLSVSYGAVQMVFKKVVVHGWSLGMVDRISYGIICFLLLLALFLFALVIHTVIYFVCKSYHHENIDKSALSDHLEVYLGEYVPLKSKDVQLEQFYV